MSDDGTGWSALPDGMSEPVSFPETGFISSLPQGRQYQVLGLGAYCDLGRSSDERSQSFDVNEYAAIDTGDRVVLDGGRGFTLGWGSNMHDVGQVRDGLTVEEIRQHVLTTVLPDDDDPVDDHPWALLAELARNRGLDVTEDQLRSMPYEVVLSDRLTAWLESA